MLSGFFHERKLIIHFMWLRGRRPPSRGRRGPRSAAVLVVVVDQRREDAVADTSHIVDVALPCTCFSVTFRFPCRNASLQSRRWNQKGVRLSQDDSVKAAPLPHLCHSCSVV